MAAVTAVVTLMLAIAFQPLPFREPDRLIEVWNREQSGAPVESLSGAELIELQAQTSDLFTSLGGFTPLRMWRLDEDGRPEPLRILRMEAAAFRALDLAP